MKLLNLTAASFSIGCLLVLVSACFNPSRTESLNCSAEGECPDSMVCGVDNICLSATSGDASTDVSDSRPLAVDAAIPVDAMPVDCTGDVECETPPGLCFLAGTCNLQTNTCSFPSLVCPASTTCTNYVCNPASGVCDPEDANENAVCEAESCGPLGVCENDTANSCNLTGTQSQECSESVCAKGACVPATETVSQACVLNTNGDDCAGGTTCGNFDACEFDPNNSCTETGTQSRTCTDRVCADGGCTTATRTETVPCARITNGDDCNGGTTCGNYGICNYGQICDETGSRSRTCTDRTCSSGSCVSANRNESINDCTRPDTFGEVCGGPASCGGTGLCCCSFNELCNQECLIQ